MGAGGSHWFFDESKGVLFYENLRGQLSYPITITARRVLRENGDVVFGRDDARFAFYETPRFVEGDQCVWGRFRLEVKSIAEKTKRQDLDQDHIQKASSPVENEHGNVRDKDSLSRTSLIMTALEYSSRFYMVSPFLRPNHHGRVHEEYLREEKSARTTDPFETGKRWTAAFDEPKLADDLPRRFPAIKGWLFGLCEDFNDTVTELRKSSRITELEIWTKDKSLRFGPFGVKSFTFKNYVDNYGIDIPTCLSFLDMAIHQAMAGPEKDKELPKRYRHCVGWVGVPVAELVEDIYRDHVYQYVSRFKREQEKMVQYSEN